jgi:hypothetical protein
MKREGAAPWFYPKRPPAGCYPAFCCAKIPYDILFKLILIKILKHYIL